MRQVPLRHQCTRNLCNMLVFPLCNTILLRSIPACKLPLNSIFLQVTTELVCQDTGPGELDRNAKERARPRLGYYGVKGTSEPGV